MGSCWGFSGPDREELPVERRVWIAQLEGWDSTGCSSVREVVCNKRTGTHERVYRGKTEALNGYRQAEECGGLPHLLCAQHISGGPGTEGC